MAVEVRVRARELWNDTLLDVVEGEALNVRARGFWIDLVIPCGAGGYGGFGYMRSYEARRRCPEARWFELVGCVGTDLDACFPIGGRDRVTAPRSGRLYLFANDVPNFYCNNIGALQVSIGRV